MNAALAVEEVSVGEGGAAGGGVAGGGGRRRTVAVAVASGKALTAGEREGRMYMKCDMKINGTCAADTF